MHSKRMMAVFAVVIIAAAAMIGAVPFFFTDGSSYSGLGTQADPYTSIDIGAHSGHILDSRYVLVGSSITVTNDSYDDVDYNVNDVTSGYGLTVNYQGVSGTLTGTAGQTVTIAVDWVDYGGDSGTYYHTFTIVAQSGDANPQTGQSYDYSVVEGQHVSYSPTFNVTTGLTLSLSGTAVSAFGFTKTGTSPNFTISGTAPAVSVNGGTASYSLTITATTSRPAQTATQTINFTVYDRMTAVPSVDQMGVYNGKTISAITTTCNYNSGVTYTLSYAPAGLSISSAGQISGTVTESFTSTTADKKTMTATVIATHAVSKQSVRYSVSFDVYKALSLSGDSAAYAVKGTALSVKMEDDTGGVFDQVSDNMVTANAVTYTGKIGTTDITGSSHASNGIYVDSSTGAIVGTPSTVNYDAGYTIVLTATHAASGQTASKNVVLHVQDVTGFTSLPSGSIIVTEASS